MYGFGIVGCGVIAPLHADAVASLSNARLVAVTDIDHQKAERLAMAHGAVAEPDLSALLSRSDVDVVSVCVPSGIHARVAGEVARAGKHVVVEKPLDVSLGAVDDLLAVVKSTGTGLTVVSQRRWDPGFADLRALVDHGRLGRLVLADAHVKWYRSQAYYDSAAWRGTWAMDGGGALMNQGIHYVDLLLWLLGPVEEVTAVCATQSHDIEVEDVALALLRFAGGAVGTIEVTTSAFPGFPERVGVSGTAGSVVVETGVARYRELAEGSTGAGDHGRSARDLFAEDGGAAAAAGGAWRPAAISERAHAAQLADFLDAMDEGREPAVTGRDGRASLEVVLAVYESARRGEPVKLPIAGAELR